MDESHMIHRTCVRVSSADDEEYDAVSDDLPKKNPFVRGSDPRVATCRGRLQTRRCQLNQEINKELRLRAGAENLFKATTNRKLRETVALELSFVNSNLQLLKEQLAELNSSVELYQNDSKECVMPMIPLGLKETKEVDFREPFKDFILEHYSEHAAAYEDAISDFMDMRQAIRTPVRSTAGVALLFKYYNQLYFIERRFFPPDRSLGVYFEWFDSLTGVPSCQRTVAFEKACVLFNMAGIYTQIGAKQERNTASGLDGAVDCLLRAAGTLRYIHENFTNAPSVDLAADTLDVLVAMMMAQARECLFEKLQLQAAEECAAKQLELRDDLDMGLDLAQESAHLALTYTQLHQKMQSDAVFNYVPYSWVSLIHVKTEFYKALAHHYCATALLQATGGVRANDRIRAVYSVDTSDRNVDNGSVTTVVNNDKELDRAALGRAHLVEALTLYEEALRLQRMCRELRGKEVLARLVRQRVERALRERAQLDDEPQFAELVEVPEITPSSKFQLSLTSPDFAQHRVEDLFKSLGPIAIFSAKRHWSAPRLVQLQKHPSRRDSSRKTDRQRNGHADEQRSEEVRSGAKSLRNNYEKRDRSEDNSTYYNQILRSDEKYIDLEYETNKKLNRITKQNGLYINGCNNNIYDYHPKLIDHYDYRTKLSTESYVKTSTENGLSKIDRCELYGKNLNGQHKTDRCELYGKHQNGHNKNDHCEVYSKSHNNGHNKMDRCEIYGKNQNGHSKVDRCDVYGKNENGHNKMDRCELYGKNQNGHGKLDRCDVYGKNENGHNCEIYGNENGHNKKNGRDRRIAAKNGDPLRRVSSDFNVSIPHRSLDEGFGFSVRGDAPVIIAGVEPNSLADIGGMREGDFIVSIAEKDVKWSSHEEVVRLIQQAGDTLTVKLVTPMDRTYLKSSPETPRQANSNQGSVSAASTASSGSTGVTASARSSARRAPSWNPFRRHTQRDNSSHRGSHTSNVIFR